MHCTEKNLTKTNGNVTIIVERLVGLEETENSQTSNLKQITNKSQFNKNQIPNGCTVLNCWLAAEIEVSLTQSLDFPTRIPSLSETLRRNPSPPESFRGHFQ